MLAHLEPFRMQACMPATGLQVEDPAGSMLPIFLANTLEGFGFVSRHCFGGIICICIEREGGGLV